MIESRWGHANIHWKVLFIKFEIFHNKNFRNKITVAKSPIPAQRLHLSDQLMAPASLSAPGEDHYLRVWLLGLSKTCKLKKAPCCMWWFPSEAKKAHPFLYQGKQNFLQLSWSLHINKPQSALWGIASSFEITPLLQLSSPLFPAVPLALSAPTPHPQQSLSHYCSSPASVVPHGLGLGKSRNHLIPSLPFLSQSHLRSIQGFKQMALLMVLVCLIN